MHRELLGWLPVVGRALPASTNPVIYGQQLCTMLKSGISQQKAW